MAAGRQDSCLLPFPPFRFKKLFMQNFHSDEQATISVSDLKSGEVIFAYSVNKQSSAHGKQSTAEACAKHLKDEVEKKK